MFVWKNSTQPRQAKSVGSGLHKPFSPHTKYNSFVSRPDHSKPDEQVAVATASTSLDVITTRAFSIAKSSHVTTKKEVQSSLKVRVRGTVVRQLSTLLTAKLIDRRIPTSGIVAREHLRNRVKI